MNNTIYPDLQPRRPWVASIMSLALPGWGQLYNGEANRAIWFFLTFSLLSLPGTAVSAIMLPPLLMVPALILGLVSTLGLWIYSAVDAYRVARRSLAYVGKPWQTSGLYALVFITCAFLVLPSATLYMRAHLVQPFYIPSTSMAPTLLRGDYVFADMHYNCPGCRVVQRGDVAIFTYPNDRTKYYVKRIVALPGDRVRVLDDQFLLNGEALAAQPEGTTGLGERDGESSQIQTEAGLADMTAEQVVPPGQVFLLGDNRSQSTDSRHFGTVPLADVAGRVRQIWFSYGDRAIRWGRIGDLVH